jgi:fructosamine-3-kinase
MDIQKIVLELVHNKIIHSEPTKIEPLHGGTVSKLFLLNVDDRKYVVKSNEPQVIESEANFLHFYNGSKLLPKLIFVENTNKYILYSFLSGTTKYVEKNKKEILKVLVEGLINLYRPAPKDIGWGWADEPADSWNSFLFNEMLAAQKIIHSRLELNDHHYVFSLVEKISQKIRPYFLHGDCGLHNFIFNEGQLSGVIDPTPIIGDPLYDLIYAYCSTPDELTKETIDSAVNYLNLDYENGISFLYEKVLIGLYLRLGLAIKHQPGYINEYINAWYYWIDIVKYNGE